MKSRGAPGHPKARQDGAGPILATARAQAQGGKPIEAAATLHRLVAQKPRHAEAWFELGCVLMQARKWHEAAAAFQTAASLQPRNAGAVYHMGVALLQAGRTAEAEIAASDAIAINPRLAEAFVLRGLIQERLSKPEAAIAAHREAVACAPRYAEAHFQLGRMLHRLGRFEDAVDAYTRTADLAPGYADAHNNLAMVLRDLRRYDEAAAALRKAIEAKPGYDLALCNLGNVLRDAGKPDEAVEAFHSCIAANPQYVHPYVHIANIRRLQKNLKEAGEYALRAIRIDGADPGAHGALGYVRQAEADFEKAIVAFKRVAELAPKNSMTWYDLGTAYRDNGQLDEAIAAFRRALELEPRYPAALNNLGLALQEAGDFEGARLAFREAIEFAPKLGLAYGNLAQIVKFRERDDHVRTMEALLTEPNLAPEQRVSVLFGLAKAYDDIKDYAKAFEFLHEANRLKHDLLGIDLQIDFEMHERLIGRLDASFFDLERPSGDPSATPIFVVGMARSGTTLVEQILASHSQVHGAGELIYLQRMMGDWMQKVRDGSFPLRASGISGEELRRLGAEYVAKLRRHSATAPFITDKMPFNFRFVGFLKLILPNARIVHCMRDPLDICISSYKRLFSNGVFYSYDLRDLGLYYNSYRRLVEHWRTVLPGAMFDIQYEDLVANQEERTRELLAYCGLPWEDGCLNFHENERAIRTASLAQVRQPIYKTSVASSRKYFPYIQPLLETLGIDGNAETV